MANASTLPVTRWSQVLAGGGDGPAARAALESLCQADWFPLYAFHRRRGHAGDEAEGPVQGNAVNLILPSFRLPLPDAFHPSALA